MATPSYSIVIPAFNESRRIGASLDRIRRFLEESGWDAEVIVVNDGSTDDTAALVRSFAGHDTRVHLLENPCNSGKGYSVRHGMLQARGEWLVFSDADLSAPISEAVKLVAALRDGADVAIGSRWVRPELMTERQPVYRQLMGRVFNLMLRVLLGLQFKDTQCGLKAFTRRAALELFPRQRIERWAFDPELLFLARRLGLHTVEVPVEWAHGEGSKINPVVDGMRMMGEIMSIRWNAITGRYQKPLMAAVDGAR
ncbi:MAG: dolichyl-phosphate beta-glucosyltransferase [Terriglobales bacterium]|jgi:glycosyltransferase involved in cell wall biosynthesis